MPLTTNRLRLMAELLAELEQDPDVSPGVIDAAQLVRYAAYLLADHRAIPARTTTGIANTPGVQIATGASADVLRHDWQHRCATEVA